MDLFQPLEQEEIIYSVSELTKNIKELLETSLPSVVLQGEISNFTHHSSGHMYFSLKDAGARIASVMWKNRNAYLFFTPQDGMKINAWGNIRVYEKRGNYQLDIVKMTPAGVGELQAAFERLKSKLYQEGLFDDEHKSELPFSPQRIGIVTSSTGAAIHDIIHVLQRRYPVADIIFRPAKVQGDGAAQDIADAISELNEYAQIDIMIVGRGGGSLEDLWAFNEEIVARAIYHSAIPVVSAVGHEIDFTISDFVADLRAPTPSAAAEMVVPDISDIGERIAALNAKLKNQITQSLHLLSEQLIRTRSRYGFTKPEDMITQNRQRLDEISRSINSFVKTRVSLERVRTKQLQQRLAALHPESILNRGYCFVWSEEEGQLIKAADDLKLNDKIGVHFKQGGIKGIVTSIDANEKLTDLKIVQHFKTEDKDEESDL